MIQQALNYSHDDASLIGQIAYDDSDTNPKPAVMIVHAFEGCNNLMIEHAQQLAQQGYVGFAVDMYGDGYVGETLEDCITQITPFFQDRSLLRARINAAYTAICNHPQVDANKVVAIGFCFGGMCVLDLARSGANIQAVVSAHGILAAPENIPTETISAKVLALHGYLDPQITAQQLQDFCEEMSKENVDWQLHYFGTAKHAFTDPHADKIGPPNMGRAYDPVANTRTWEMAKQFFTEALAD